MLVVGVGLCTRRHLSGYHYGAMVAAAAYAGAAGVVVALFAVLFVLAVLAGGIC